MSESNRRRGFNHGEQTPLSTWSQRDSLSWEYPAVPARPARFSTATRTNLWSHGYYLYWKDAHCGVLPARAYSLLPDGKPAQLHEPRGRRRAHLRQPARPFIAGAQLHRQGDPGPARSCWRQPAYHGRRFSSTAPPAPTACLLQAPRGELYGHDCAIHTRDCGAVATWSGD